MTRFPERWTTGTAVAIRRLVAVATVLTLSSLTLAACSHDSPTGSRDDTRADATYPASQRVGLRADSPSLGKHGPYWVGHRSFDIPGPAGRLVVDAWYPARNPNGLDEEITYPIRLKNPSLLASLKPRSGDPAPDVRGHALRDAPFHLADGPFPLVVFSHGYSISPAWYAPLVEHYASHGFVVLAPEHGETDWPRAWAAAIDRPVDIASTLHFAETATAPGGSMAGMLDTNKVAAVGHSFGGYTALAAGGARLDLGSLRRRCAEVTSNDDPTAFFCAPFAGKEAAMASHARLDGVPHGLWPSMKDPHVDAIVTMAGDAYPFGETGLSSLKVPMMAIGGTVDVGTPWELGAKLSFDHAGSRQKALVALEGANHFVATAECADMAWTARLQGPMKDVICDRVWDRRRALDAINHYSTAFLKYALNSDQAAQHAMESERPPGIRRSFAPATP